ncbi:hypothetical protein PHYPSEUDO_002725 [Phytophthora pseudosyringae]|uniref:Uncharacterized protein n=1 Tax=Phytophthora pseudosyringae TaxID=221518 RepID=A0A8T1WF57_9STRA|nr:hypothetical protein PHYPSEUDO_002725 [Phytophthora pseudosyringae]
MSYEAERGGNHEESEQTWEDQGESWLEQVGGEEGDSSSYRAYTPQLMDTHEMHALRTALNRSEMQIQQQGHLQEYAPRKPASSKLRRWYGLQRNHRATNRPTMSAGPSSRPETSELSSKKPASSHLRERPATSRGPICTGVKTAEFARILKEEACQVRGDVNYLRFLRRLGAYFSFNVELKRRYEDTKRSLLDYIDVVSSCRPNDRVGGQEVYEQLADLISFASRCTSPE